MVKVGIVGGSGFGGAELMRLAAAHPELEVVWTTGESQAGRAVTDLYPSLIGSGAPDYFAKLADVAATGCDVVFCALPHGGSQKVVPGLLDAGVGHIVDLAADFRLRDPATYGEWYDADHTCPELIERFAYGIPELFRDDIAAADHVAVAGCYPTSVALLAAPLVAAGLVDGPVMVAAHSGVTGAGRSPSEATTFAAVNDSITAYGLLRHRHTPEMEQAIGAPVSFTPHLAPMSRGIHATVLARAASGVDTESARQALTDAYRDEPFVAVLDSPPRSRSVVGANSAQLSVAVDHRTSTIVGLSVIDNLGKGAAGQAIQCANLLLGLPETTGLPIAGVAP